LFTLIVALNYHTLNWWVFIIYSFVSFAFESCIFFMDDNIQGYVTQYKNNFVSLKKKEISNLTATFRNKILIRKRCKIDMNRNFYYWLNLNWAFTSFLLNHQLWGYQICSKYQYWYLSRSYIYVLLMSAE
jgi:hypothetical protein